MVSSLLIYGLRSIIGLGRDHHQTAAKNEPDFPTKREKAIAGSEEDSWPGRLLRPQKERGKVIDERD